MHTLAPQNDASTLATLHYDNRLSTSLLNMLHTILPVI